MYRNKVQLKLANETSLCKIWLIVFLCVCVCVRSFDSKLSKFCVTKRDGGKCVDNSTTTNQNTYMNTIFFLPFFVYLLIRVNRHRKNIWILWWNGIAIASVVFPSTFISSMAMHSTLLMLFKVQLKNPIICSYAHCDSHGAVNRYTFAKKTTQTSLLISFTKILQLKSIQVVDFYLLKLK